MNEWYKTSYFLKLKFFHRSLIVDCRPGLFSLLLTAFADTRLLSPLAFAGAIGLNFFPDRESKLFDLRSPDTWNPVVGRELKTKKYWHKPAPNWDHELLKDSLSLGIAVERPDDLGNNAHQVFSSEILDTHTQRPTCNFLIKKYWFQDFPVSKVLFVILSPIERTLH